MIYAKMRKLEGSKCLKEREKKSNPTGRMCQINWANFMFL